MSEYYRAQAVDEGYGDRFSKCSVLLFETVTDFRRHTRDMLGDMGFGRISDTGDFENFRTAVASGGFDLMIGDTGNRKRNVCDLVRKIRHNSFGRDPFLGVILTMAFPSNENVQNAVNSGTDHLIAKPYSPNQVSARIQSIVDHRKPFVVTLNYVGPDRRDLKNRPADAELLAVPNALRAKVRNDPTALATREAVRKSMIRITRLKVQRYDLEIGVLVELIGSAGQNENPERGLLRLKKIRKLLGGIRGIAPQAGFINSYEMCTALTKLVTELAAGGRHAEGRDLEQLEQTSMALHLCFHPEKTVTAITEEIAFAVAQARNDMTSLAA